MAECVDREALRNALYDADAITMKGLEILNRFPATEVEAIHDGHWIPRHSGLSENWVDCSECGTVGSPFWRRCPVCEAKMRFGQQFGPGQPEGGSRR